MNNLYMMLKSGYCPPPEKMDKKTAQFFVCYAYLRFRHARQRTEREYGTRFEEAFYAQENEAWNHLQVIKQYYYKIK